MPRDFTAYTNPGIYVELIDPPVNNNTSITPTIVAVIGTASDEGRAIKDSTLMTEYSTALSAKGIDPFSLTVKDQYNLLEFTNAAIGRVTEDVNEDEDDEATLFVTKKSGFILPDGIANADFDGYRLKINDALYDATLDETLDDGYEFTITSVGGTGIPFIPAQSIVNIDAPYVTPIKVGVLASTLASGLDTFEVVPGYENTIQTVSVNKTSGTVPVGTATLKYVEMSGTVAMGTVSIDLVDSGSFITAADVAEKLADYNATVIKKINATTIDYTILFGIDDPEELSTNTTSVVSIASRRLTTGDLIQVAKERILVTDYSEINDKVELVTVRGADGTQARQHGTDDVYWVSGYDYFVSVSSDEEPSLNGVDDITLLSSVSGGRLSGPAQFVQITGRSTDAKQFAPEMFRDLDNIRIKYGKPFSNEASPKVVSNITLAAQLALRNGADRIYCVATESNSVEDFESALAKLEGIDEINVVVPITAGMTMASTEQVISALGDFCESQASFGNLIRGFVALDGKANRVNYSDFTSLAKRIHDSRISLVAPSRFSVQNSAGKMTVGGPFAAAAVAGLHARLGAQIPLTRKQLELSIYSVEDSLSAREMMELQAAGVLVLAQESGGQQIVIRHGLTTDMTSVYSREVSVVAARDRLRDLVYDTLLSAGILGSPITANTPEIVVGNIIGALELAKSETLIFDYSDVKYRIPTNNPTSIEIRFAYRPTMPLNYVLIQFSVDTTSSAVTFQSINEGGI